MPAQPDAVMLDCGHTLHVHVHVQVHVPEVERTIILNNPDHHPRRWIVGVAHSWFKRFWKPLIHC